MGLFRKALPRPSLPISMVPMNPRGVPSSPDCSPSLWPLQTGPVEVAPSFRSPYSRMVARYAPGATPECQVHQGVVCRDLNQPCEASHVSVALAILSGHLRRWPVVGFEDANGCTCDQRKYKR